MTSKPISTQNPESSSILVSSRKVRTFTPSQIYGEAGLIYIRHPGRVEDKPGGQKKIGGSRPAYSRITKQLPYGPDAGSCYSLLMGREFRPGRWAILLDFDNKSDEHARSGLELVERLNMRQHGAPCQSTPREAPTLSFTWTQSRGSTLGPPAPPSPTKVRHTTWT